MQDKQSIVEQLKQSVMVVEFTKVNGDRRVMTCTLKPDMLPPSKPVTESTETKPENPNTVSVWDVNAKGWRSFRIANIVSIGTEQSVSEDSQ